MATDPAGNIYIADSGDNRVREVLSAGSSTPGTANVQTVAGTGTTSSTGDGGLATAATLSNPQGVAIDNNANIYIAEGSRVRAVCVACSPGVGLYALLNKLGVASPSNGNIYTIAGTSSSSNSKLTPGLGNTVSMAPQKLTIDADGNLYIADSANNVVWFEDGRTGYTRVPRRRRLEYQLHRLRDRRRVCCDAGSFRVEQRVTASACRSTMRTTSISPTRPTCAFARCRAT